MTHDHGPCDGHDDDWSPGERTCPVCGAWYVNVDTEPELSMKEIIWAVITVLVTVGCSIATYWLLGNPPT